MNNYYLTEMKQLFQYKEEDEGTMNHPVANEKWAHLTGVDWKSLNRSTSRQRRSMGSLWEG